MKERTRLYTFLSLLFLLLLAVSGSFSGLPSILLYISAFVLPTAVGLYFIKREEGIVNLPMKKVKNVRLILPIVCPALLLIFLISYLTSLIIHLFGGADSSVTLYGNVGLDVLFNAALPALLEESFFRLLPLLLIAPYSKRGALVVSSLCFAFAHTSLHSIPYALFAGITFFALDLLGESVWPSVALHFVNNVISLAWIYGSSSAPFCIIYIFVLVVLSLFSVAVILKRQKEYKRAIQENFLHSEEKHVPSEILFFIAPTLFIAIINVLG